MTVLREICRRSSGSSEFLFVLNSKIHILTFISEAINWSLIQILAYCTMRDQSFYRVERIFPYQKFKTVKKLYYMERCTCQLTQIIIRCPIIVSMPNFRSVIWNRKWFISLNLKRSRFKRAKLKEWKISDLQNKEIKSTIYEK